MKDSQRKAMWAKRRRQTLNVFTKREYNMLPTNIRNTRIKFNPKNYYFKSPEITENKPIQYYVLSNLPKNALKIVPKWKRQENSTVLVALIRSNKVLSMMKGMKSK